MTTDRDDHVDVDALGVTVRIALGGLPQTSRDALTAAWAGARPGTVAPPVEVVRPRTDLPLDAAVADVTTRVTLAALAARRGELWMVHAAAAADERGRVVVFSGRSGMGKTTLVTQVARRYAYVTDESVGVASDGGVLPYRKPLSVIETPAAPKRQVPPESLDLRPLPRAPLRLHAIVVLDRDDAHAPARLEALDIAETLGAVAPQSSYLAELDGPLQSVIRHIQAVGGAHRLRYRQAEEVIPLVDALFAAPRPETGVPIRPEPIVGAAHDTGFARSPVVDAVALDGGRLALLRRDADGQTSVHVVDGIGPTLWRAATGVAFDDLVAAAVDEHGAPDRGDARAAVRTARATLQESGLIRGPAESPARAGTGGTPGGELSRRVSGRTPGCDMDAMSQNDVTTRSNRGQWENAVEGRPELSASYSSREEAVDQGRATADELGSRHIVEDAEPTGAPTDEG